MTLDGVIGVSVFFELVILFDSSSFIPCLATCPDAAGMNDRLVSVTCVRVRAGVSVCARVTQHEQEGS